MLFESLAPDWKYLETVSDALSQLVLTLKRSLKSGSLRSGCALLVSLSIGILNLV